MPVWPCPSIRQRGYHPFSDVLGHLRWVETPGRTFSYAQPVPETTETLSGLHLNCQAESRNRGQANSQMHCAWSSRTRYKVGLGTMHQAWLLLPDMSHPESLLSLLVVSSGTSPVSWAAMSEKGPIGRHKTGRLRCWVQIHSLLFPRATCLPCPLGLPSPGKICTSQSPGQGQAFFLRLHTYLYTGSSGPEGTASHKCPQ